MVVSPRTLFLIGLGFGSAAKDGLREREAVVGNIGAGVVVLPLELGLEACVDGLVERLTVVSFSGTSTSMSSDSIGAGDGVRGGARAGFAFGALVCIFGCSTKSMTLGCGTVGAKSLGGFVAARLGGLIGCMTLAFDAVLERIPFGTVGRGRGPNRAFVLDAPATLARDVPEAEDTLAVLAMLTTLDGTGSAGRCCC